MIGTKSFGGVHVIIPPSVPFFGINPCPEELEAGPRPRYPAFGLSIPNELFPHIYEGMKEARHKLKNYEGEHLMVMQIADSDICKKVCDQIWPEAPISIGIVVAVRCRDGEVVCRVMECGR